ncbi:PASTA domain-containing protein [uncultured Bacteroides sp.]|uniref:PASTA domain-containing protein n=1 Tax=uncultured Bacteroides sp. TaxID=162156 RepID=UPI002582CE60|nr:PASTA domain-containing protein [uncultured Bacteroides sp.]
MITLKEFFSFKQNRFFWLNLIAMIVVVIGACWGILLWLDHYTHHGEAYVVPNVKNKSLGEAQLALHNQKLEGLVVDSSYVKGLPDGMVLDQNPAEGARVKEGRTIYLTVTTSKVPLVKLPDLVDNSSLRQAEAKLKAMGFRLTEPEYVSGEQDWIYGIKYRGRSLMSGDKVPHEAMLTLCVGNTAIRDSLAMDSTQIMISEGVPENSEAEVDDSWF